MQRKKNRTGFSWTARRRAAGRRKGRLTALLCGLLLCCAAAAALRACAREEAPAGCSLKSRVPDQDFAFPLGTSGWYVSSGYGWRVDPFDEEQEDFHQGVDLACSEGTPVLAAMDGVVFAAGRSASYGNYIRLTHSDGTETLYAHLQYLYARPGQVVRAGEVLGTAGQTGRATGPHLHFELLYRAVRYDPSALLGLEDAV
ncbi:hypothetical protein B5G28_01690 [Faecalibacterium sp. An77]|nr:hypothetical protein B5G28_01690 [Faecalibacterium sp. An77]